MSLRFIDGFDHYNPATDLLLKYTSSVLNGNFFPVLTQGTGRYGGFCMKTKSYSHFLVFPTSQPTWTIGFGFKYDNIGMLPLVVVGFVNAFAPQITVYLDSAGRLNIGQGFASPPTIVNTGTPKTGTTVLVAGTWYYIESQITVSGGNMTACAVQLNGASEIAWTGSKAISAIDSIVLGDNFNNGSNNTFAEWYDDLYVLDGSGSINNTFLGDQRVETIYPTANGAVIQTGFIGSGSAYQQVNTQGSEDGDTTYLFMSTPGNIDTFVMGDLSTTPTTVAGISVTSIARKDDAGTKTFCGLVRLANTNYVTGNSNALNSSYKTFQDLFELNPNTSTAWTGTTINAMEAGVKLLV